MKSRLSPMGYILITLIFFGCGSLGKKSTELVIYKSLSLKATKQSVWAALTEERELKQWWGKGVKLEPRVGGQFYEPWGDGQLATGKVVHVNPKEDIRFTWREKYWASPGEVTACMFTIKETKGTTDLEVAHSGWESFSDLEKRKQLVEGFHKGWDLILAKLKKYLERS